jgi:hypothetical protein
MAANTHLSMASWNLALDAAINVCNGGFFDIYDSTGTGQPATPDVAVTTQVKLAHCALSATAFGASASGVKTANAISNGTGLAVGTATWFRVTTSSGTAVWDGSVGTSGTDCIMADTAITVNGSVPITSCTISMPVGQ